MNREAGDIPATKATICQKHHSIPGRGTRRQTSIDFHITGDARRVQDGLHHVATRDLSISRTLRRHDRFIWQIIHLFENPLCHFINACLPIIADRN
jgi:hypothetical protein